MVRYRIERCSVGLRELLGDRNHDRYELSSRGLSPSTAYSYRVRAQDAVPNVGAYSNTATATT